MTYEITRPVDDDPFLLSDLWMWCENYGMRSRIKLNREWTAIVFDKKYDYDFVKLVIPDVNDLF